MDSGSATICLFALTEIMAYYYNPVTGVIKKITSEQKKAYDEHFRERRATSILEEVFGNETTIPLIISLITILTGTAFAAWLLALIYSYLEETGGDVSEAAKGAWSSAVYGGQLTVDVISKPLTGQGDQTIPLPPGAKQIGPVGVTYNQLWEYGRRKLFPAGFAGVF